MKTTMKQLAAGTVLAFLLLAGNVQAKGTEAKASGLEITETQLTLENWMVNENVWNKKTLNWVDEVADEMLSVENWMTDESTWNSESKVSVTEETENTMELENWMINNNVWER